MRLALMFAATTLPLLVSAQAPKDCRALQAEITALKARIKVL